MRAPTAALALALAAAACKEPDRTDTDVRTCDRDFISKRQTMAWYRSNGFGDPVACTAPKKLTIPETVTVPIYWADAGTSWTQGDAQAKIDEARRWFETYCITVEQFPISRKQGEKEHWARRLAAANARGKDAYRDEVIKLYDYLWTARMGKPREFHLVLFVDDFAEIQYGNRVDRVSGNFSDQPIVLINALDRGSTHILTHELIHALGRGVGSGTPPGATPWDGGERQNTWDEGGCANDMGNASRGNPGATLSKPDADLLDWASHWQFIRAKNIR